jgi:hypothetical protein
MFKFSMLRFERGMAKIEGPALHLLLVSLLCIWISFCSSVYVHTAFLGILTIISIITDSFRVCFVFLFYIFLTYL